MQASYSSWEVRFTEVLTQIGHRFSRRDLRRRAESYLRGLLGSAKRKNGWQLAEEVGDATPYGIQRLLSRAVWDADAVRDDLCNYVVEHLGDKDAVLIVDETGFIKKGIQSAGVARQYSGTAGRIENSQIGVFLAYRSHKGGALIDRALYLPQAWTDDRQRCRAAGIPDDTGFMTKPQLAGKMLKRAFAAGTPVSWVTADTVYGGDSKFRKLLEKQGVGYVVAVACQQRLFLEDGYVRVDEHVTSFPQKSWKKLSCGSGTKGERFYEWLFVPFGVATQTGLQKGLLVRRSLKDSSEHAYYFTCAPTGTPLKKLVQVAGSRWVIEECFEQAKQETGLDEYEVRSWVGWYRHITLSMFAHAFLAVIRSSANSGARKKRATH